MPELPEVETVMRGLSLVMTGERFAQVDQRRPNLRFPLPENFVQRLTGRTVTALHRRAKYVLVDLDTDDVLVMHLGMSGRFTIMMPQQTVTVPGDFRLPAGSVAAHDHIVFTMSNGATITYNDARRFGFMDLIQHDDVAAHKLFSAIGPEPLGNAFHADHLRAVARGRAVDLKALLMDQRTVAGLGNIYVCEALWRASLSPRRIAGSLVGRQPARDRVEALVMAVRSVLVEAIAAGGSTLRDYKQVSGELGYFQKCHAVYGCEGKACQRDTCSGTIARITQSGRSTFYCPACQR
jgi:formamidopyrimidine-DNA glycosylase